MRWTMSNEHCMERSNRRATEDNVWIRNRLHYCDKSVFTDNARQTMYVPLLCILRTLLHTRVSEAWIAKDLGTSTRRICSFNRRNASYKLHHADGLNGSTDYRSCHLFRSPSPALTFLISCVSELVTHQRQVLMARTPFMNNKNDHRVISHLGWRRRDVWMGIWIGCEEGREAPWKEKGCNVKRSAWNAHTEEYGG